MMDVVLDTNVLVSALRSKRGASHSLLRLIGTGKFDIHLSVPVFLEYEAVAKRLVVDGFLRESDVEDILDYLCGVAKKHSIFYLWRPFLRDPKDDMVLELAVASDCNSIVTYNLRDFSGVERFGIRVITPHQFLKILGDKP